MYDGAVRYAIGLLGYVNTTGISADIGTCIGRDSITYPTHQHRLSPFAI